jgi:Ca2+-binding RTX toxin-like protein
VRIAGRVATNDRFDGGEGIDTLVGTTGDDAIVLDDKQSSLPRLSNIEHITTGAGNDLVDLTSDRLTYGAVTVEGGAGNDVLWTSAGADSLNGGDGDDSLAGGAGDDSLTGGSGADNLKGGTGNDRLEGGTGADQLDAGPGDDKLIFTADATWTAPAHVDNVGSPGRSGTGAEVSLVGRNQSQDTFDGGTGIDTLFGTTGNDAIILDDRSGNTGYGGNTNGGGLFGLGNLGGLVGLFGPASSAGNGPRLANIERIATGPGNDVVDLTSQRFNYGDVTLDGGSGDDTLWSAGGNDSLVGGTGNDTLVAGAGRDTLDGGTGNDRLEGGIGNDVYRFARGTGQDTILENDSTYGNVDTLKLSGIKLADLVFRRAGADLDVMLNGTTDSVRIKSWYDGSRFQVEHFETDDGTVLLASQVQALVNSPPVYWVAPAPLPTPFTPVPEQWLP